MMDVYQQAKYLTYVALGGGGGGQGALACIIRKIK